MDNYDGGVVINHNGQWVAGVNGAQPGIIMPARPKVGQTYQQEYAPGIAEDMATVLSVTDRVRTEVGRYRNCLKTLDFTPLEPGLEEHKWYCPGVGFVMEEGPDFTKVLVSLGGLGDDDDDDDRRGRQTSGTRDDNDDEDEEEDDDD